jgi:hypothetical protein
MFLSKFFNTTYNQNIFNKTEWGNNILDYDHDSKEYKEVCLQGQYRDFLVQQYDIINYIDDIDDNIGLFDCKVYFNGNDIRKNIEYYKTKNDSIISIFNVSAKDYNNNYKLYKTIKDKEYAQIRKQNNSGSIFYCFLKVISKRKQIENRNNAFGFIDVYEEEFENDFKEKIESITKNLKENKEKFFKEKFQVSEKDKGSKTHKRLLEGFKELGYTEEDITKMKATNTSCTFESGECICGHPIKEHCYIITHKNEILALGNCCIKKFITKDNKLCDICERPHKNRITNKCKECKKEILDELKQSIKNLNSHSSLIKKYL